MISKKEKWLIFGSVSIVILIGLVSTLYMLFIDPHSYTDEEYIFDDIKDKTNVSFKTCKIINKKDTHGDFLGDGKKIVIYQCDKNFDTGNNKQ